MGYYNQINRLTQFPLAGEGITPSLAWQFKPKGVPVCFFGPFWMIFQGLKPAAESPLPLGGHVRRGQTEKLVLAMQQQTELRISDREPTQEELPAQCLSK